MAKQPKNPGDPFGGFLRRLRKPGIDIGALEVRRRKGKKKQTPREYRLRALRASKAATAKRKERFRKASAERVAAMDAANPRVQIAKKRPRLPGGGPNQVPPMWAPMPIAETLLGACLRVMRPGQWYGAVEVNRLAGLKPKRAAPTLLQKALPRGLVEKARNADWDPARHSVWNGLAPPRIFWRLTRAGELAAIEARILE